MKCQRNHGNQIKPEIESGTIIILGLDRSFDCFEALRFPVVCSSEHLQHKD